jgi:hypothetical protein
MKRCAPQNPAPSYFESVPIPQQLASYTVTLQARKKAERPGDTNGNTLIRWRFIYRDNKRRKKKGTVIPHVHTVIWLEERAAKCYSVTNENGEYGFQITLSAWQCSADTLVVSPHHKILFDYFVTS